MGEAIGKDQAPDEGERPGKSRAFWRFLKTAVRHAELKQAPVMRGKVLRNSS
jgi:hypothetical protein